MRYPLPSRLEAACVAGNTVDGGYGSFRVMGPCGVKLFIVASAAHPDDEQSQGWEHVSVSKDRHPPNWQEMCFVKDLFWRSDECVVQFHPPESDYVNNHPRCLHLWWHVSTPFPQPPAILVGVKAAGTLNRTQATALMLAMNP